MAVVPDPLRGPYHEGRRNVTDHNQHRDRLPATEVFAYATDPTRFNEWQKGVVDGHMDQPGSPEVGAHCSPTPAHRGDRPAIHLPTHPHRTTRNLGVHGIDGPIRATVDVTVVQLTEARSRLTISVDFGGH